jgi:hypothetical protein
LIGGTNEKPAKDWPLLTTAVDAKIDEQSQFIEWWKKDVRRPGRQWPKK